MKRIYRKIAPSVILETSFDKFYLILEFEMSGPQPM